MRLNLQIARRVKGIKTVEMAEDLDISLSFYYKIEAGSRDPSFHLALDIADILEKDNIKELFEVD